VNDANTMKAIAQPQSPAHRSAGRSENSTLPLPHLMLMLAGLALAASPHVARAAWWIGVSMAAAFLYRLYIAWKEKPLPSKLVLVAMAVLAMVGVFLTFRTFIGRDAGVTLLTMLLALKLMEMRAARDVFVLIFGGYFVALTNFFYSQTMPTGVLILLTVLTLTTCLVSIQAPERPIRANLRTAGTLLAQASPVMLLLFFLFPRVQGPGQFHRHHRPVRQHVAGHPEPAGTVRRHRLPRQVQRRTAAARSTVLARAGVLGFRRRHLASGFPRHAWRAAGRGVAG